MYYKVLTPQPKAPAISARQKFTLALTEQNPAKVRETMDKIWAALMPETLHINEKICSTIEGAREVFLKYQNCGVDAAKGTTYGDAAIFYYCSFVFNVAHPTVEYSRSNWLRGDAAAMFMERAASAAGHRNGGEYRPAFEILRKYAPDYTL